MFCAGESDFVSDDVENYLAEQIQGDRRP